MICLNILVTGSGVNQARRIQADDKACSFNCWERRLWPICKLFDIAQKNVSFAAMVVQKKDTWPVNDLIVFNGHFCDLLCFFWSPASSPPQHREAEVAQRNLPLGSQINRLSEIDSCHLALAISDSVTKYGCTISQTFSDSGIFYESKLTYYLHILYAWFSSASIILIDQRHIKWFSSTRPATKWPGLVQQTNMIQHVNIGISGTIAQIKQILHSSHSVAFRFTEDHFGAHPLPAL